MVKKAKNKVIDFNKEIIVKTSLKHIIVDVIASILFVMLLLYIGLTEFNEEIVSIFNGVINGDFSAITVVLIVSPIFLIIKIMLTLGQHTVSKK